MKKLMRGMGVAALTALVASCSSDAVAPIDDATLDAIASEAVADGRGRGHRMANLFAGLEADGDQEAKALVAVAREHLAAARTARDQGDGELARSESRASRDALHEAAQRTFPEMTDRGGAWQRSERRGVGMEGLSEDERASMRERMKARRSAGEPAFSDGDTRFRMQSSEGRIERLFEAAQQLGNARVSELLEQARAEVQEARLAAEQGDEEQARLHQEALREILGAVREELPEQFQNRGKGFRGGRRSR